MYTDEHSRRGPAQQVPWWRRTVTVVCALFFLPPLGAVLVWLTYWSRRKKAVLTAVALLWTLVLGSTSPEAEQGVATPPAPAPAPAPNTVGMPLDRAEKAATSAGYAVRDHDASDQHETPVLRSGWRVCFQVQNGMALDLGAVRAEAPCSAADGGRIPWPRLPDVTGKPVADASAQLRATGIRNINKDGPDPGVVCSEDPAPGGEVRNPKSTTVSLHVAATPSGCRTAAPHPEVPAPDPPPPPERSRTTTPSPERPSPGPSPSYKNCTEVRRAGKAPLYVGEPGYSRKLDRDGDGTACEK